MSDTLIKVLKVEKRESGSERNIKELILDKFLQL